MRKVFNIFIYVIALTTVLFGVGMMFFFNESAPEFLATIYGNLPLCSENLGGTIIGIGAFVFVASLLITGANHQLGFPMGFIRVFRFIFTIFGLMLSVATAIFVIGYYFPQIEFLHKLIEQAENFDVELYTNYSIAGGSMVFVGILFFIFYGINVYEWFDKRETKSSHSSSSYSSHSTSYSKPSTSRSSVSFQEKHINGLSYYLCNDDLENYPFCVFASDILKVFSATKNNKKVTVQIYDGGNIVEVGFISRDGSGKLYGLGITIAYQTIVFRDMSSLAAALSSVKSVIDYSLEQMSNGSENPAYVFKPYNGPCKFALYNHDSIKDIPSFSHGKEIVHEMRSYGYYKTLFDKIEQTIKDYNLHPSIAQYLQSIIKSLKLWFIH